MYHELNLKGGNMKVRLILGGIGVFCNPKFYWIRWTNWKMYYGIDHRCNCEDVAFAPCTICGAGT